jgi:hypothetical protein
VGSRPFSATTLPRIEPPATIYRKEVMDASRMQFGAPREEIEAALFKEFMDSAPSEPEPKKKSYKPSDNRPPLREGSSSSAPKIQPREELRLPAGNHDRAPRTVPEPKVKTAQDLKDILRTMQASAAPKKSNDSAAKGNNLHSQTNQKLGNPESSLKGALADVLKKHAPTSHQEQEVEQKEQKDLKEEKQPTPQSAPPKARPQESEPEPSQQQPQQKNANTQTPFEVPEEVLRSIFKD